MSASLRHLVLAAACALLPACLSFRVEKTHAHAPPGPGVVEALAAGTTTLADALEALGAPLYVWELPRGESALAWGWRQDHAQGATLSVPIAQSYSASLSYDELEQHMDGLVLRFDADLVAADVRLGKLNELRELFLRRRPTGVDELERP